MAAETREQIINELIEQFMELSESERLQFIKQIKEITESTHEKQ